ncbi:DegV family protein [Clostridiaceae bacterium 35-E11]
MNIKIVADSSCDLNKDIKQNVPISLVPLTLQVDDQEYKDDETLDVRHFLKLMKDSPNPPKTASPSPLDFMKHYEGEESVFVVTLSSALSSTYDHAILAKNMFLEKFEHKFIHVFDSLSASVAETLISLKIFELGNHDYKNHEIVEKVDTYIGEMRTFFILDTLENLIKAGRINRFVAKLASAFSIKPIMGNTDKGTITLIEKARGSKKAFNRLVEVIGEQGEDLEEKILGIAHCNCIEKAEKFKEEVMKRYHFKDIIIVETKGLSSAYANQNGLIIAF